MKIGILQGIEGIGKEIMDATMHVLESTGVDLEWEYIPIGKEALNRFQHPIPNQTVKALKDIKVAIKTPLVVNKLEGRITCIHDDNSEYTYPSLNNAIRRELSLFMNMRPAIGIPGLSDKYGNLDVVIMREVTEGVYIGHEHKIGNHAAEAIKLITRESATKAARFSFEYAQKYGRQRVTCVHKANVLNYTDGLFLECFNAVAKEYPDIESDDYMIDAACYTIIKHPEKFDVITAPNQYGDILSDLIAGLIGSLGLAPGANYGDEVSIFEASHGAAPDIEGLGIANPIALILSGALMLRHIGEDEAAKIVENATRSVLSTGLTLTPDLGGTASTMDLAHAIACEIEKIK